MQDVQVSRNPRIEDRRTQPRPREDGGHSLCCTSLFFEGICQDVKCLDPEPQNQAKNSRLEAPGHLPGQQGR